MKKNRKIDPRLLLLFGLLVLVLVADFLFVQYYRNNRARMEKSHTDALGRGCEVTFNVYADMADSIYHLYIDVPEVKRLFTRGVKAKDPQEKNRWRRELLEKLSPLYQRIRRYDFRQLHFHEADNRSYLRFHRPGKFGDDLTKIRYSVAYVNREREYIRGFEEGAIFNGYRFVYPLSEGGEHLGSVEISVSINSVIGKLISDFDREAQFIILRSQVMEKVFKSELSNYIPWCIDDRYLLDRELAETCVLKKHLREKDVAKLQKAMAENRGRKSPFIVEIRFDSKPVELTFLPILDFLGEEVAYIYTITKNWEFRHLDQDFLHFIFGQIILLCLLILFMIYYRVSQKKIENMATFDSLTQVYARGPFLDLLSGEFRRFKRYGGGFSLLMIDVDHFKRVNDQFGHQSGDRVLSEIAAILRRNLRETDLIGRYGGEEFIVLLPETRLEAAVAIAGKLLGFVSSHPFPEIGSLTISCGAAAVRESARSEDDVIAAADEMLYQAKNNGRNRVEFKP